MSDPGQNLGSLFECHPDHEKLSDCIDLRRAAKRNYILFWICYKYKIEIDLIKSAGNFKISEDTDS